MTDKPTLPPPPDMSGLAEALAKLSGVGPAVTRMGARLAEDSLIRNAPRTIEWGVRYANGRVATRINQADAESDVNDFGYQLVSRIVAHTDWTSAEAAPATAVWDPVRLIHGTALFARLVPAFAVRGRDEPEQPRRWVIRLYSAAEQSPVVGSMWFAHDCSSYVAAVDHATTGKAEVGAMTPFATLAALEVALAAANAP